VQVYLVLHLDTNHKVAVERKHEPVKQVQQLLLLMRFTEQR